MYLEPLKETILLTALETIMWGLNQKIGKLIRELDNYHKLNIINS